MFKRQAVRKHNLPDKPTDFQVSATDIPSIKKYTYIVYTHKFFVGFMNGNTDFRL